MAVEWLESVEKETGSTPMIYVSPSFMRDIFENPALFAPYPVWVAHYTTASAPSVPKPWESWTFWQYTNHGTTPGVQGFVDCNWFNGTIDQLGALRRPEGASPLNAR
jgi:lysozyme